MSINEKEVNSKSINSKSIKFYIKDSGKENSKENDKEIARAYLYIIKNDLHKEPYGLMEDVFVDESKRGKGLGSHIVKHLIEKAKEMGCYKLICTSRYSKPFIHELYKKLGFKEHGKEFRINF